ncbi:hypothetical protein [Draconibacterium halophilum]|uniref:O-antigen ligase-like membrane protein n=1 Tax=Draconibacterium halophilum TaxID=2706887 RepID=A0A6C0REQ1_9BACT|nr:hypothetical protein [Draconibacterium halophilum]QIA08547.1 hypothetical protein G0Q07_12845 [Draconibacterium halophilum]
MAFIGFFMPFYALSVGLIKNFANNSSMVELVYLNSFFFFFLLVIIVTENIQLRPVLNISALLLVAITAFSYIIPLINPGLFAKLYTFFVTEKEAAVYALRNYGSFTLLMVFYKTSPILVFPLAWYLHRILILKVEKNRIRQIVFILAISTTLFLSGTRANILSMGLILLFYIFFYAYKKSKPVALLVAFIYLVGFFYGANLLADVFLNRSEVSNQVKLGHLFSYIEHFSDHVGILLFGQGIGSTMYTSGINSVVSVTELTYFELIRVWGLPVSIVFGLILLIPIYQELKSGTISHLFIAYIAYLFIAGTNPLLLSSTGMLVLVYVFSQTFSTTSQKDEIQ